MMPQTPNMPDFTTAVSEDLADADALDGAVPRAVARDLAEVMDAYNAVTQKLQTSHERLQSEVVRLRRELASADVQLQRSRRLAALGEMAAGIAHEVRNPLAAIQLFAGLIDKDLDDERAVRADAADGQDERRDQNEHQGRNQSRRRALENSRRIAEAVRGLDAVVGDVLAFAKPMSPRVSDVDPLEIARTAIDTLQADAELADATISLIHEPDQASWSLHADAHLLRQALLNLLRNAVQAVDGRDARTIDLRVSQAAGEVAFEVTDSGPGIGDQEIDRLFNPFFTTRSTGTGLGLAIVHRIADAHGGSVTVWNRPQGGAAFRISVPSEANNALSQSEVATADQPLLNRGAA